MNKQIMAGIAALALVALAGVLLYPRLFPAKHDRTVLYWTDPMIPGDRSDHPGPSPMGMERVPVYADAAAPQQPAGAGESYYTCPMHPSVRSDKPGACPVCGMALVKRTKAADASAAEIDRLQRVSLSASQRVIANVATTAVGRNDIDKEVRSVGVVEIAEPLQAKVTARFNGRIERLFVGYSGAYVRKGEPLFDLHSPDLVSAEQELILAVNAAQADSEALEDQSRLLTASRERLHVHFGMSSEQIAAIEQRQSAEETMTFLSPISGTVIAKEIQEGDYVNEGTLLYRLADLSTVWVSLDVYERDLPFIHIGHPVRLRTEAYPNETFTGKVSFIDPVVNPETRTVRVRSEFANAGGRLKPQMYVSAEIHAPSTRSLTVPASSVLYTGTRTVAWVEVAENTFEPRVVELGTKSEGYVEVLRGLREGEMVVTSGGFLLESESQLQQPAPSPATPHEDHDTTPAHKMPARDATAPKKGAHEVVILVDGSYTPETVEARSGEPITLAFDRRDDSRCTDEVVLEDFGVRRTLPTNDVTRITIHPKAPGRYTFACGMGMLEGTIVVR